MTGGVPDPATDGGAEAAELIAGLRNRSGTLAVAESLTGGLLAATLTRVPGASVVFRGAVVAYATDVKASLLEVRPETLDRAGAVSAECAREMAAGVRSRLGTAYGLSTTGVAGPDPQEGHPPGLVYVGLADGDGAYAERLDFTGDRQQIRTATCVAAIGLLRRTLESAGTPRGP
ncbi:MAG: nicotinamide-nucleotide amidohydrolase family protein [Propionibacteriales bacterium]|nr:nicotinamide-nucleotide amidohydrolase family protein [Propionibacteriales bacterium]